LKSSDLPKKKRPEIENLLAQLQIENKKLEEELDLYCDI
jgi:hypothetical protein